MVDPKMLQMLQAKSAPVEDKDKQTKMAVLHELMKVMDDVMSPEREQDEDPAEEMSESPKDEAMEQHIIGQHPMDANQVTVAAKNPEDLQHGLGMAKQLLSHSGMDQEHPDMMNEDDEDEEDMY